MGLIRFLFACGVILVHTGGYVPINGNMGIQCFYILSGFYMCLVLNQKYTGKDGNLRFYKARAIRIYPIYWITLALMVAWSLLTYILGYPGTISQFVFHPLQTGSFIFLVLANIFLVGLDSIFFLGLNGSGALYFTADFNHTDPHVFSFAFNSIAWTIGVELLFYLVAPFILRRKIGYLVLFLLLSLGLRITLTHFHYDGPQWNYMFFPTQLMFFMAGGLGYHFLIYLKSKKISNTTYLILFLLYAAFVLSYNSIMPEGLLKESSLFIATVLIIPVAFGISMKSKVDRYLGEISYPIYISQGLIITVTTALHFTRFSSWGLIVIILSILYAVIMHQFITLPIARWNRKHSTIKKVPALRPSLDPSPV